MKNPKKTLTSSSSESPTPTRVADKNIPKKTAEDGAGTVDDIDQKIDRPGFDLSGSSGDTDAGTGLGLGEDAFETPGGRRLPGRRLDNKLTIPRWGGPDQQGTTEPAKKPSESETQSETQTKKGR